MFIRGVLLIFLLKGTHVLSSWLGSAWWDGLFDQLSSFQSQLSLPPLPRLWYRLLYNSYKSELGNALLLSLIGCHRTSRPKCRCFLLDYESVQAKYATGAGGLLHSVTFVRDTLYRGRQNCGPQVARMLQASWGSRGKQQQKQNSPNLGTTILPAPVTELR